MKFKQKKFRKVPDDIAGISQEFFIGVPCKALSQEQLQKIGIDDPSTLEEGFTFLPSVVGKVSDFNANGRVKVRKDLPKETIEREYQYTRTEYHGKDNPVQVEDSFWRKIERYPREHIPAPEVSLSVYKVSDELHLLIQVMQNDTELLHKINLALEVFSSEFSIHIQSNDGLFTVPAKFKMVSWVVLPSGQMTKEQLREAIEASLSPRIKKTVLPVIKNRLAYIRDRNPEEVVLGFAGYRGYVVHNFTRMNLSILESESPDNATYVFEYADWEHLSKLTKMEIISNKLAKARVIHDKEWQTKISRILMS